MNNKLGCVILAAGEGTRMKSELPKVLFPICGKTMIEYVIEASSSLNPLQIYVVIGYKADLVKQKILSSEYIKPNIKSKIVFVTQKQQLGSGHALLQTKNFIDKKIDTLLTLSGDVPLIEPTTLKEFYNVYKKTKVDISVLCVKMQNPQGYGRIIKTPSGDLKDIVEEQDATEIQKKIKEVNAGIYIFKLPKLWSALKKIRPDNVKKEYYLTDVVKFLPKKNVYLCNNPIEVAGVNTRADLVEIESYVKNKIIKNLMLNGVSIVSPETVYITHNVKIEPDVTILPGSVLENVIIEKNCEIGPYTYIKDSTIAEGTKIVFSYIEGAKIGPYCKIGPYSRIRPQTILDKNVSIGNFVELKNSVVQEMTKINHLSYIGDSEIEKMVNIGAGSITCNYDGVKKHKTYIGANSFIGSNVNIIAPIKIGHNVVIAAGSTVTKDVPPYTFVIAREKEIHKVGHRIVKRIFNKNSKE